MAARISFELSTSGLVISFNIDYAATLIDACTVVATFISIDDAFPEDVANALMSAAVLAA